MYLYKYCGDGCLNGLGSLVFVVGEVPCLKVSMLYGDPFMCKETKEDGLFAEMELCGQKH